MKPALFVLSGLLKDILLSSLLIGEKHNRGPKGLTPEHHSYTLPSGEAVEGGKEGRVVFEGRAAIGYDHGYDAQKFYLGLALDPKYIEGFVEGCLERMGEDEPEDEALFRDLWDDEGERETMLSILQAECEVLTGRPDDYFPY